MGEVGPGNVGACMDAFGRIDRFDCFPTADRQCQERGTTGLFAGGYVVVLERLAGFFTNRQPVGEPPRDGLDESWRDIHEQPALLLANRAVRPRHVRGVERCRQEVAPPGCPALGRIPRVGETGRALLGLTPGRPLQPGSSHGRYSQLADVALSQLQVECRGSDRLALESVDAEIEKVEVFVALDPDHRSASGVQQDLLRMRADAHVGGEGQLE